MAQLTCVGISDGGIRAGDGDVDACDRFGEGLELCEDLRLGHVSGLGERHEQVVDVLGLHHFEALVDCEGEEDDVAVRRNVRRVSAEPTRKVADVDRH
jgi:hypothetical protein